MLTFKRSMYENIMGKIKFQPIHAARKHENNGKFTLLPTYKSLITLGKFLAQQIKFHENGAILHYRSVVARCIIPIRMIISDAYKGRLRIPSSGIAST